MHTHLKRVNVFKYYMCQALLLDTTLQTRWLRTVLSMSFLREEQLKENNLNINRPEAEVIVCT